MAAAYTAHPCSVADQTRCSDATCDAEAGICDQDGCGFNSYRMGDQTFFGPGRTIDTTKKFTVVTQFITDTGTASGTLSEIRRIYIQNGVVYQNSQSKIFGVAGNSVRVLWSIFEANSQLLTFLPDHRRVLHCSESSLRRPGLFRDAGWSRCDRRIPRSWYGPRALPRGQ
jgi:hypothetical protein